MDLYDLADMMESLGCETALNLDGGGSTMVGVQYPGYDKCATANTPTDGSMRACANFIFLVREKTQAEEADHLFLYPAHSYALPGATVNFALKAADRNYMATDVPGSISWSTNFGAVGEGKLVLDTSSFNDGISDAVVSAKAEGMSARATVTILQQVTGISVYKEDGKTRLKTLHTPAETDVQLRAGATYYGSAVLCAPGSFTWEVTGGIGTITESGKFTSAKVTKLTEGTIEVSYGETTASIPITVSPANPFSKKIAAATGVDALAHAIECYTSNKANPFSDTKGHWAETYINDLYFEGTLTGSTGKDGKLLYRPDDSMTRQEFIVALMRYLGTDLGNYSSASLPFADTGKIGTWALDAVKAAYSLGYLGGSKENGKLYANPTATITRQEAMVILARSQNLTDGGSSSLSGFSDAPKVADWAKASLAAMVDRRIIGGSNGKLNPTGKVTRAEVAKMLWALENN